MELSSPTSWMKNLENYQFFCNLQILYSGTYSTPQGKKYVSAFLGLQKMETEKQNNNGEKINDFIILSFLSQEYEYHLVTTYIQFS